MDNLFTNRQFSGTERNLELMREFQATLRNKPTDEPYDPEKHLPKEWLARLKGMKQVKNGEDELLISDEEQRMIDYGAMEIDWTPPYPCVNVVLSPNPNWDDSWPLHEEKHALQVDDPDSGPRAKKIKWIPRHVPLKMWEYEAEKKGEKRRDHAEDANWDALIANAPD